MDFADLLSTEHARFKIQAVAQRVKTPDIPPAKQHLKNEKKVDRKTDTKRVWLPTKEYLAKLAADKAASADQAQPSSPNRGRKRSPDQKRSRSPSRRHRSPAKDARRKIPETKMTAFHPVTFLEVPKDTNDT